ncbi:MAG: glycosyltransferase family 9 protein, partial [Candidatus Methylomirabilis sp.]
MDTPRSGPYNPPPMEGARRILVIRLGAVGDVVRTMTALGPLRRRFPQARISWIAEEGPATLLRGHPCLDETIVLPRRHLGELFSSPSTFIPGLARLGAIARDLRSRRYDLVLDFHGTLKSGLVSFATGALVRWGYAPPGSKEMNRLFNTHHVHLPSHPLHRIERNLALVR